MPSRVRSTKPTKGDVKPEPQPSQAPSPQLDLTLQYLIPMCKIGQLAEDCVYKRVILHPCYSNHKGKQRLDFIRVTCADSDEYEPLGFYPEYFEYLLNVRHYITIDIPKEINREDSPI